MGLRLLLLLVLALLVVRWAGIVLGNLAASQAVQREPRVVPPPRKERLVGCSVCGVHVAESQLLTKETAGALVLCSEACRERARAAS